MKFLSLKPKTETVHKRLQSKHAEWLLAVVSFTESSIFPILVDPFLVAMILANTKKWFRYATIAVVASVLGGVFGYILGAVFFDIIGVKLISFYHLEEAFKTAVVSVNENAFLFTLVGAFTPLPYKIVVIVGGFMKINFWHFIAASIIGRSGRFYIVAYISNRFGELALLRYVGKLHLVWFAILIAVILYTVALFV